MSDASAAPAPAPAEKDDEQGLRPVARDQGPAVGAARGARLPQLHRQAVLHPVGIDDAGPAHRRPAGGQQISLWLVVGSARASTSCRRCEGRVLGKLPERGDIVIVTPPGTRTDYIKRVIGLPGDTLEMRNGKLIINGQAVKRQHLPEPADPDRRQFAVRIVARSRALPVPRPRPPTASPSAGCRSSARPCPTAAATTRSSSAIRDRQFRADDGARRPPLADGRQSRRFGRQPGRRMARRARRAGPVREYRRARRVHHLQPRRLDRTGAIR